VVKVKAGARLVMERARFSLGRQIPARREGPHSRVWSNDHFRAASPKGSPSSRPQVISAEMN
jgi:hypothetical protein